MGRGAGLARGALVAHEWEREAQNDQFRQQQLADERAMRARQMDIQDSRLAQEQERFGLEKAQHEQGVLNAQEDRAALAEYRRRKKVLQEREDAQYPVTLADKEAERGFAAKERGQKEKTWAQANEDRYNKAIEEALPDFLSNLDTLAKSNGFTPEDIAQAEQSFNNTGKVTAKVQPVADPVKGLKGFSVTYTNPEGVARTVFHSREEVARDAAALTQRRTEKETQALLTHQSNLSAYISKMERDRVAAASAVVGGEVAPPSDEEKNAMRSLAAVRAALNKRLGIDDSEGGGTLNPGDHIMSESAVSDGLDEAFANPNPLPRPSTPRGALSVPASTNDRMASAAAVRTRANMAPAPKPPATMNAASALRLAQLSASDRKEFGDIIATGDPDLIQAALARLNQGQ